jgi:hypothetical protein
VVVGVGSWEVDVVDQTDGTASVKEIGDHLGLIGAGSGWSWDCSPRRCWHR